MHDRRPTETDARRIAERFLGATVHWIQRFTTGAENFVFDVQSDAGARFVVRIATEREVVVCATAWHKLLAEQGVPLPTLLAFDTSETESLFPYMILERLPGVDLGAVYPALSAVQKQCLAKEMVWIQQRVALMPRARRYGYARSYDDPGLHPSWGDVLRADLDRSRRRIAAVGVIDPDVVTRVVNKLPAYRSYLKGVAPIPFLDDITTKNVIIANGRLSGIVDVDVLAFGDPLLTPALTHMALLSRGYSTDYIDYWCEAADVTRKQQTILTLYTALFCVNFMGEVGQQFNRDIAPAVDPAYVAHLDLLLHRLLAGC